MGTIILRSMVLAAAFALLCAVMPTFPVARADDYLQTKRFVYYIQESLAAPNTTIVFVAGQNNNLTSLELGLTTVFDSPLTLTPDENAPVIGSTMGGAVLSKDPNVARIYAVHTLNSTDIGVGAFEWTGIIGPIGPGVVNEMVVTGGTGDFKFHAGVAAIELVYPTVPPFGPYRTFKFSVTLVKYFTGH